MHLQLADEKIISRVNVNRRHERSNSDSDKKILTPTCY